MIIIGTLLVAAPLAATSFKVLNTVTQENQVRAAAEEWIEGTNYELVSTTVTPDSVEIRITGTGDAPPRSVLMDEIQENGQDEVTVILSIVPSQLEKFTVQ